MIADRFSDDALIGFLDRIRPDYGRLVRDLRAVGPEDDELTLAGNIMEFGRGQVSQIGEPDQSDLKFIKAYIHSLDLGSSDQRLFAAYAAGCMMGLVKSKQLPSEQFLHALALSRDYACQIAGK
jgi:hypothetical protein